MTPLGKIKIDRAAIARISVLPQVEIFDSAHAQEHSLEVQLPFLQVMLDDFELIPLVVGDASRNEVAEVLNLLWGGDETLIVISSDLSHYNSYSIAQQMDRTTSIAIEKLHPEQIHYDMACGRNPVNGLLEVAKQKHHCTPKHWMCGRQKQRPKPLRSRAAAPVLPPSLRSSGGSFRRLPPAPGPRSSTGGRERWGYIRQS